MSGEMAQLMMQNQEKYVPSIKHPNECEVHVETIFFDGDALTEERARNVQWTTSWTALRVWTHCTQNLSCMK